MSVNEPPGAFPLISAIMPAHNAGCFLRESVQSIFAQTYPHWELVFVDDGSDDDTFDIIQSLAAEDKRIKTASMHRGGRGRARNACLELVTGEYVAICDSDDICFPERFEKQLRFMESNSHIGVVGSWSIPFSSSRPEASGRVKRWPTNPQEISRAFSRNKMPVCNAAAMIRAELFRAHGSYNPSLQRAQDYEFFGRLHRRGILFAALPEPLVFYRMESPIPSLRYFRENGMYKAYADRILEGREDGFQSFSASPIGRAWRYYLALKYLYFLGKSAGALIRHELSSPS